MLSFTFKEIMVHFFATIVVILFCVTGFFFEAFRWHTFEAVTHSHISFWTWLFLFGGK